MFLTAAALLLGLVGVLVAVYRDSAVDTPMPSGPAWEPLPTPADVAHFEFPMSVPGYDPASVELHLDQLRQAYADLVAVAPPEVLARARRRADERAGVAAEEPPPVAALEVAAAPEAVVAAPAPDAPAEQEQDGAPWPADDSDALRLEAVLARVDPPAGSAQGSSGPT